MVQEIGCRVGRDPVGISPGYFQMAAVEPSEGGIRDHIHIHLAFPHLDARGEVDLFAAAMNLGGVERYGFPR